jgi:MFS family permease
VAYCGDLGHGAARGAQMLSLMLGFGIVSRLASGWVCDQIGGRRTLLLSSSLQALALALFLPFDNLPALYTLSALFGLVQGGLVPSYTVIVREFFPPEEAGVRGHRAHHRVRHGAGRLDVRRDLRPHGSYHTAFVNGIL